MQCFVSVFLVSSLEKNSNAENCLTFYIPKPTILPLNHVAKSQECWIL